MMTQEEFDGGGSLLLPPEPTFLFLNETTLQRILVCLASKVEGGSRQVSLENLFDEFPTGEWREMKKKLKKGEERAWNYVFPSVWRDHAGKDQLC